MLALVLQVLGVVAVTVGAFMVAPFAGVIVGGVLLTVVGLALERSADAE